MGSFPSKNAGPQIRSPRHGSISGRIRVDSPRIGSHSHSSSSRLAFLSTGVNNSSPGGRGGSPVGPITTSSSLGKISSSFKTGSTVAALQASEITPLVPPIKPQPLLLGQEASSRMLGEAVMAASPPLALWIGPALACALAYALYNIFIKKGSASINPILGGVILQFVAALLGCCLLSGVVLFNSTGVDEDGMAKEEVLMWDWAGVRWAVLAGVAVGAAEMISFCVSGMGVQAMQSIPIIIGGSVMFGTVLGYVALGEELTVRGWSGVLMISIGISLVGMDDQGEGV